MAGAALRQLGEFADCEGRGDRIRTCSVMTTVLRNTGRAVEAEVCRKRMKAEGWSGSAVDVMTDRGGAAFETDSKGGNKLQVSPELSWLDASYSHFSGFSTGYLVNTQGAPRSATKRSPHAHTFC